jgi:hypothetical protein
MVKCQPGLAYWVVEAVVLAGGGGGGGGAVLIIKMIPPEETPAHSGQWYSLTRIWTWTF